MQAAFVENYARCSLGILGLGLWPHHHIIDQTVVTASTTRARRNCDGHFQLAIDLVVQNRDGKRESAGASWSWGGGGSSWSPAPIASAEEFLNDLLF